MSLPQTTLVDGHGRSVTYLRLSITDRCDFRCVYCMSEDMTFLPRNQVMDVDELVVIAAAFVRQGVTRIRLTGGEPLLHPDLLTLVSRIKALPGLQELALTTNGARLAALAAPLQRNSRTCTLKVGLVEQRVISDHA